MTIAPIRLLAPSVGAGLGLLLGQTQLWSGFSFSLFDPAHWAFFLRHAADASIGFWSALALALALPPAGAWLAWRLTDGRGGPAGMAAAHRAVATASPRGSRPGLLRRALAPVLSPWKALVARGRGAAAGWRGARVDGRPETASGANTAAPPPLRKAIQPGLPGAEARTTATSLAAESPTDALTEDFAEEVEGFGARESFGGGDDGLDEAGGDRIEDDQDDDVDPSSPPDWISTVTHEDDDAARPSELGLNGKPSDMSPAGEPGGQIVSATLQTGLAGRGQGWMQTIRDELIRRKLLWLPNPTVVWNVDREGRRLLFHDGFDTDATASADIVVGNEITLYLVFLAPWAVAGTIGGMPRQAEPRPDELKLEGLEDWTTPDGIQHPCPLTRAARALRRFRGNWSVDCRLYNWRPEPDLRAVVLLPELPGEAAHLLDVDESHRRRHRAFEAIDVCHTPEALLEALENAASDGDAMRRIEVYRRVLESYTKAA